MYAYICEYIYIWAHTWCNYLYIVYIRELSLCLYSFAGILPILLLMRVMLYPDIYIVYLLVTSRHVMSRHVYSHIHINIHIISTFTSMCVHTFQLACLSTMGGAYSICQYPRQALRIAQRQEQVGIRANSKPVQCHAKLYQYINLIFLGKKKAGLKMLQAAKVQAEELEGGDSLRKHCDITENWLNNEIKYKYKNRKPKIITSGDTTMLW